MKTEHEKLQEICKKIWYKIDFESNIITSVTEIIFTQEFMDKIYDYLYEQWEVFDEDLTAKQILEHLDDPTGYLYKIIFNN